MGKSKIFLLLFLITLPFIYAEINTTHYLGINTHQTLAEHYSEEISYSHIALIIFIIMISLFIVSFFEHYEGSKIKYVMYKSIISAGVIFAIPALIRHFFNQGWLSIIFEDISILSFAVVFIAYNIFFLMNFEFEKNMEKMLIIILILGGVIVSFFDNFFIKTIILLPIPAIIALWQLAFGKKLKKEIIHLALLAIILAISFVIWDYFGFEKMTILQVMVLIITTITTLYANNKGIIKIKKKKFEPLILQFFFIIMMVFIISASINIKNTKELALKGQENEDEAKIWNMEFQTEDFSGKLLRDMALESKDICVINGTYDELYEEMTRFANQYDGKIDDIYRLDKNGIIIGRYPYQEGKIGQNYSAKQGIKETLIDHKVRVTEIIQTSEGKEAITIISPIMLNGELEGVLRVNIYLESFTYYFDELKLSPETQGIMFDNRGEVIASREERVSQNYSQELKQIIETGLGGGSGKTRLKKVYSDNLEEGFLVNYRPIHFGDKNFLIILYSAEEDVLKTMDQYMIRVWQLTFVWMILLILLGVLMNYFMTKELKTTVKEKTQELEQEKDNVEKKVIERTSEIQILLNQKTGFINQLSHDLRTPLSPIVTMLPIIKGDVKNKKTKKDIDVCIRNAEYLNALVNKILDLARLEAGRLELKIQKVHVNKLVNNLLKDRKVDYQKANIRIVNKTCDCVVVIDPIRITEVIDNILNNAKKHMSGGGIITINAKKQEEYVIISIKDTGEGIKKEDLDSLFREFFKADSSRHEQNSFGLGLAISRYIIELHGGKIWAESEGLGEGATFYFTLPLKKNEVEKTKNHEIENDNIEPKISWSPNLSVNDLHLDNQHRRLIQKLNDLNEAIEKKGGKDKIKEITLFLEQHASEHFKDEEEYLKLNQYPELDQHKKKHEEFFKLYGYLRDKIRDEATEQNAKMLRDFLIDWLTKHLIQEDQKYAKYIQDQKNK